jgi:hypothetical protein
MRIVWLLLIAACGANHPGDDADAMPGTDGGGNIPKCSGRPSPVSFQNDVVPLIGHCGSELCHGGIVATTWPYSSLVGVATNECSDGRVLVQPHDAANSYLIQKLAGVDMCMGMRMPKLGTPFDATQIQTLVDWICQGANNN